MGLTINRVKPTLNNTVTRHELVAFKTGIITCAFILFCYISPYFIIIPYRTGALSYLDPKTLDSLAVFVSNVSHLHAAVHPYIFIMQSNIIWRLVKKLILKCKNRICKTNTVTAVSHVNLRP